MLATSRLSKRFGGLVANDNIDFAVEAGEIRGIIGPNGAGKTTLVNLITGIYPPSAGEIRLAGENLAGLAPHQIARRGLVRTIQVSRLFGNLSLRENLLVPYLAHTGGRELEAGGQQADRLLKLTKL